MKTDIPVELLLDTLERAATGHIFGCQCLPCRELDQRLLNATGPLATARPAD